MPEHWRAFTRECVVPMNEHNVGKVKAASKGTERHDKSVRMSPSLSTGNHILIDNEFNRRRDRIGMVVTVWHSQDDELMIRVASAHGSAGDSCARCGICTMDS